MNKDAYALMKARQEIAMALIDKLEIVKVEDIGLIPALMDYVRTGNKDDFEEYKQYHFVKSCDEKIKNYEETIKKMESYKKKYDEYIRDYNKWYDDVRSWSVEMGSKVRNERNAMTFQLTLGKIRNYLNEQAKELCETPNNRALWVRSGKKLFSIKTIEIIDNKVIMSTNEEGALDIEIPILPESSFAFHYGF